MSEPLVTWHLPTGWRIAPEREEVEIDFYTGEVFRRRVVIGQNGWEVISERVTRKGGR